LHDPEDELRLAMREMRAALRRGPGKGGKTTAEKLNRARFAQSHTQKVFKKARRSSRVKLSKPVLLARFQHSPILDALLPQRRKQWVGVLNRVRKTDVAEVRLEDFSFLSDPNRTLESIKLIGQVEGREPVAHLHFQDDYCLDIGPYLVLAEIWPFMAPVFDRGRMMPSLQKVIRAVGIHRQLGMTLKAAVDEKDIYAFPVQRRRPANTSRSENLNLEPQRRERVADGFCDAVDRWLGQPEISQRLSMAGRAWISNIIGELLDNAERHSRPLTKDGDWSLAAFMARRQEPDGENVFRCFLGFLSVGSTIAESLETATDRVKVKLQRYCSMHSGKGTSTETLSTLFALQDGITRDPQADAASRGGYGLQEVLELVDMLGHSEKPGWEPRVTILSGGACIQLRGPYLKGQRMAGPESPRVLWFNPSNASTVAPDRGYVFDLRERFAGTLISVAFTLDPDYYSALAASGEDRGA
jgi:two-component sensor histidine kinase